MDYCFGKAEVRWDLTDEAPFGFLFNMKTCFKYLSERDVLTLYGVSKAARTYYIGLHLPPDCNRDVGALSVVKMILNHHLGYVEKTPPLWSCGDVLMNRTVKS